MQGGLAAFPFGVRSMAMEVAADWLHEYLVRGWSSCAIGLVRRRMEAGRGERSSTGQSAPSRNVGSQLPRAREGEMELKVKVVEALARSMLSPRLGARLSSDEIGAFRV